MSMREYTDGRGGKEFDCPNCGANVRIGWKMATAWGCQNCKQFVTVPWPDEDEDEDEGE